VVEGRIHGSKDSIAGARNALAPFAVGVLGGGARGAISGTLRRVNRGWIPRNGKFRSSRFLQRQETWEPLKRKVRGFKL
jgi:hypothetical protein